MSASRAFRLLVAAVALLVLATMLQSRYCRSDRRQAIRVEEYRIVVTNLTDAAWSDVEVWLNDYYRAQADALAPGQRLEVPLDVFVAGYGQRFDRRRQAASGIEVTARGADGGRVALTWGRGRRR